MPSRVHDRVPVEEVKRMLRYSPETGSLNWIERHSIRIKCAGAVAGTIDSLGYVLISIQYRRVRGHTLAWVLMTGEWPVGDIDHINGDRSDNRWSNLRLVTHSENMQNQRRARSDSKTGFLGVSAQTHSCKFRASIKAHGKRFHIGSFETAEAAHQAYLAAKARLHISQEPAPCPNWAPVLPPVAEPVIKFMDGTPVPADYLERVSTLVSEAADGDPGEQGED